MRQWITLVQDSSQAGINLRETEEFPHATVEPDADDETPTERAEYDRQRRIEQSVKAFCAQEIGWDMDRSYCVHYDAEMNELAISPNEGEATLDQLMKLRIFGEVTVAASASQWGIDITIKTHSGIDVKA